MSAAAIAARLSGQGKLRSRRKGHGWMAPCPCHSDSTPSLSLTDSRDGRVLWHCFGGCDQAMVTATILDMVGDSARKAPSGHKPVVKPVECTDKPVIASAEQVGLADRDLMMHDSFGMPSRVWTYRMTDGRVAGMVARYDVDGGKEIIPYTLWENRYGRAEWRRKAWPEARPLYNLDQLAARPDAPVLYCEGEKAADAAQLLFPKWVVTTHPGGGNALGKADLSSLDGRTVIVMPDADKPGLKMAEQLAQMLDGRAKVRLLVWPTSRGDGTPYSLEHGDDAADHLARGWTAEELRTARETHHMVRRFDLAIQFGHGDPECGWFELTIDQDSAKLAVLRKDGPVQVAELAQGWTAIVDPVTVNFATRLQAFGHMAGRFPSVGTVQIAYSYGAELFALIAGQPLSEWLCANQVARKRAWNAFQKGR